MVLALMVVGGAALLAFFGLAVAFSVQEPIPVAKHDEIAVVFGSRIRYRRTAGAGPPIVLVHGYNLSINDWEPVAGRLLGREVVALDLAGYGGSDPPADLDCDVACQHRYLIGFMDAVGIERAVRRRGRRGDTVGRARARRRADRPGRNPRGFGLLLAQEPALSSRIS
jgi:pimeloyl-ACP methyl ester carboxylesterase